MGQGPTYQEKLGCVVSAVCVNYLDVKVYSIDNNGKEKRSYHNSWVIDIEITQKNASILARGGRCRWKLENECFNTLKNQGYAIDNSYGHGDKNLCFNFYLLTLKGSAAWVASFRVTPSQYLDIELLSKRKVKKVYAKVETMDIYIPEPLRNADGSPIYMSINVSTSSDAARASSVGIFAHVDAVKITTADRIRKLSGDIRKVGEVHDGESTTDFMSQDSTKLTFRLISFPK